MNKKGFTLIELISAIVILALVLIIAIPALGNFATLARKQQKNNLIEDIKTNAQRYALDSGETLFFVKDLVDYGYIDVKENDIIDPTNNTNLNCYAIKTERVGDYYKSEWLNKEYAGCNRDLLKKENTEVYLSATLDKGSGGIVQINSGEWQSGVGTLKLKPNFNDENINCNNTLSSTTKCRWSTSSLTRTLTGGEYILTVSSGELIKRKVNFQLNLISDNEISKKLIATYNLNIDNEVPEISLKYSKYNSSNRTYTITASDGMGSGIAGYYLGVGMINCNGVSYQSSNVISSVSTGLHTICVKDKVGNVAITSVNI